MCLRSRSIHLVGIVFCWGIVLLSAVPAGADIAPPSASDPVPSVESQQAPASVPPVTDVIPPSTTVLEPAQQLSSIPPTNATAAPGMQDGRESDGICGHLGFFAG